MKERIKELYDKIKAQSINPREAIEAIKELKIQNKPINQGQSLREDDSSSLLREDILPRAVTYFKELLSSELKLPAHKIDEKEEMEKYGINSIMILQMTNHLEEVFGPLPKTLFFEYQTLEELTEHFVIHYDDKLRDILGLGKKEVFTKKEKVTESISQVEVPISHPTNQMPYSAMNQNLDKLISEPKESINLPIDESISETITPSIDTTINQGSGVGINNSVSTKVSKPLGNKYENKVSAFHEESKKVKEEKDMDIAIIGLAGKYPQANDVNEFWKNLVEGKDCITPIPVERWDYRLYYDEDKDKPGKASSKWGGFLDGVYNFDPLFFNISPREAREMDPQERLFLQCAYETLEDAGYTKETCSQYQQYGLEGNVGVFVGVMYEEYQLYGASEQAKGNMLTLGGNPSSIANRVSYYFNFHGPSMAIDTMCSSSLTAIHLACQSIQNAGCEMAIAGAVNVSVHPNKYLFLGKNNFLSTKGKCESFGEGGDGYVPSEGVGALLLKPLDKAIKDRDHIYGVIKGTAINHGGKTNGYTVPNPKAQAEVIKRAYDTAKINPRTVSYLEAHGTGTSLGDPIEMTGLNKTFSGYTQDKQFCRIGSVKSNIGHCESAAGIAGVTKVLLQMKHRQFVPSLHSRVLNPNIDFASTPFLVQRELEEWKRPIIKLENETKEYPRAAGISAFGAGGSNSHVIIEEYIEPIERKEEEQFSYLPNQIFVISAKNNNRLKENVEKIQRYIEKTIEMKKEEDKVKSFNNMAYTLQVGREPMVERLAIVASNLEELNERLLEYLSGADYVQNIYEGNTKKVNIKSIFEGKASQHFLDILMKEKEMHKIAELWVSGIDMHWDSLYVGQVSSQEGHDVYRPRRISMPTYSFAKEHYFAVSENKDKPYLEIHESEGVIKEDESSIFYIPRWEQADQAQDSKDSIEVGEGYNLFIYNEDTEDMCHKLSSFYPSDSVIKVKLGHTWKKESPSEYIIDSNDSQSYAACIKEIGTINRIYYVDGMVSSKMDTSDLNLLDKRQEQGVIGMFRLIKALIQCGHASKKLNIKIITHLVYKVLPEDISMPYGASLFGLGKSMSKEFLDWEVSGIDIDTLGKEPLDEDYNRTFQCILQENRPINFSEIALRKGKTYIRKLYPIHLPKVEETSFKEDGVYLIVGGAGGIGIELCLYLADKINCKFALLGRSELKEKTKEKMEIIKSKGTEVIYINGDITQKDSMVKAIGDTKEAYGRLDGVIHSAIVLHDQSLMNMTEETFRKVLSPKVTGSVVLHEAVKDEKLDFVMYFSSAQSFVGNLGQSNYAAGCSFKDAFAFYEKEVRDYSVKLINWGFWGEIGVVATEAYNQGLEAQGIYSIPTSEGMDAIERILEYSGTQVIAMKADKKRMENIGVDYQYRFLPYEEIDSSIIQETLQEKDVPRLEDIQLESLEKGFDQLRKFTELLLLDAFRREQVFTESHISYNRQQLMTDLKVMSKYSRLFKEMLHILVDTGYVTRNQEEEYITYKMVESQSLLQDIYSIEAKKDSICNNYPVVKPYIELLWICSRHIWEILRGEKLATEIIFPNGSIKLVEKIYKDNTLSDYLNYVVTWALQAYIEKRVPYLEENKVIKILEIGAGTGGTSSVVFKGINQYKDKLVYDYTDISEAFLKHGKQEYGAENPYVNFGQLNIEKDAISQGFKPGDYDLVIATNVLHATPNIKNTLKNSKRLLKKNGWLILNEITQVENFLTLTFGLLDGWWMYEDESLRLEGSPLLSNMLWSHILHEEGFKHMKPLGQMDEKKVRLSQNVIIAESDGQVKIESKAHGEIKSKKAVPSLPTENLRIDKGTSTEDRMKSPSALQNMNQVMKLEGEDLRNGVEGAIIDSLAEVLQIPKQDLDVEMPYSEYGVDSILSGQIVNTINKKLDIEMSSTALFNYPTSIKLRDNIMDTYGNQIQVFSEPLKEPLAEPLEPSEPVSVEKVEEVKPSVSKPQSQPQTNTTKSMDIAIVGMSGQFPGATTLDEYWDNLINGVNSVTHINRWNPHSYYDEDPNVTDKSYINRSGLLEDMDKFDPLFFNISPKEAELMDPQQRLFLEESWKALEDAGFSDKYLDERKCGVFVGCMEDYYEKLIDKSGVEQSNYVFTGITIPILSARISYLLNLRGPSIVVSTACSSALVAIHLACESIINGTSEIAIAGGVNVLATPFFHILGSSTGMFSYSGECRPFDNKADGFIPAEGCGVVVLKPLHKAIEDGDNVYGVILGSGINQDGKSNGITAPSAPSQADLECEIYNRYGINPEHIGYIEAHGTGTKLGDPIEIEALSQAFSQFTDKKQFCPIGSVKSNIGHTLQAAGVASLIKVLLCMKYKKLVPSVNFDKENELIPFKNSPVYVNTQYKDWRTEGGIPRIAAISSFGISGTNSHLVLRDYEETTHSHQPKHPSYIIPLSAKTEEELRNRVSDLANWLEKDKDRHSIGDIAYTLMVGRSHFSYRMAFMVRNIHELREELARKMEGLASEHVIVGDFIRHNFRPDPQVRKRGQQTIHELTKSQLALGEYREKLMDISNLYVEGYLLDWEDFYSPSSYKRISLPTYPFTKMSYWVESASKVYEVKDSKGTRLHPLVERNTATLKEHRYTTLFHEDEFYIQGHQVGSQKVMPGVVYLEMARVAGKLACEQEVNSIANILWSTPIVVEGEKEVHIGLYTRDEGEIEFEIYTDEKDEKISHAQGSLYLSQFKLQEESIDIEKVMNRATEVIAGEDCYGTYEMMGLHYDSKFQVIQKLYSNEHEALAHLKLPEELGEKFGDFGIHPSIMDGALQAAIGLVEDDNKKKTFLPFLIGEVRLIQPLTETCYAYVKPAHKNRTSTTNSMTFHITIVNPQGEVLAVVRDYNVRAYDKAEETEDSLELLKLLESGQLTALEVEEMMEDYYG